VTRVLLISGEMINGDETLRRKVLRFTGSRRATRAILKRVEAARRLGRVMSCMILPRGVTADAEYGDELGWDVRVSFADAHRTGGTHA
jgi:hypothetical protein